MEFTHRGTIVDHMLENVDADHHIEALALDRKAGQVTRNGPAAIGVDDEVNTDVAEVRPSRECPRQAHVGGDLQSLLRADAADHR